MENIIPIFIASCLIGIQVIALVKLLMLHFELADWCASHIPPKGGSGITQPTLTRCAISKGGNIENPVTNVTLPKPGGSGGQIAQPIMNNAERPG